MGKLYCMVAVAYTESNLCVSVETPETSKVPEITDSSVCEVMEPIIKAGLKVRNVYLSEFEYSRLVSATPVMYKHLEIKLKELLK